MTITLADTSQETAWRDEVREFIKEEGLPLFAEQTGEDAEGGILGRLGTIREWRNRVARRGLIAPSWPKQYGGAELSVVDQFIMNEEFAEAGVPSNVGGFGVMMIGPTLIEHGSEAQKSEHLPKILRGEVVWCQG